MVVPGQPAIANARDAGWIIPPSTLRAEIGIVVGCRVLKLHDAQIGSEYGLGTSLLQHADLGVLITSWRAEVVVSSEPNSLVNDLCDEVMVGVAVARFNGSELAAHFGIKLCVVGDPCFTLKRKNAFKRLPTANVSEIQVFSKPCGPQDNGVGAEAAMLKAAAVDSIQRGRFFDVKKGKELIRTLTAVGPSTAMITPNPKPSLSEVDSMVIDFLGVHPLLVKFFGQHGRMERMSEMGVCPSCLAPARTFSLTFPEFNAKPRDVVRCAYCDDSRVLPADWRVTLDLTDLAEGVISISGVPDGAQVVVAFISVWIVSPQTYRWPKLDGRWRAFHMPSALPSAPLDCEVLIVRDLEVGSVGFKIRKLAESRFSLIPASA